MCGCTAHGKGLGQLKLFNNEEYGNKMKLSHFSAPPATHAISHNILTKQRRQRADKE